MNGTDVRTIDLYAPAMPDLPPEWDPGDETLDALREQIRPDPRTGLETPAHWRAREQLAGDRWFLLRNIWNWRSGGLGRSGAQEPYFTYGGIERPFNGLDDIYGVIQAQLPDDEQLAAGLMRDFWRLGAIEPIEPARARWLALRILGKTGRNLYPQLLNRGY